MTLITEKELIILVGIRQSATNILATRATSSPVAIEIAENNMFYLNIIERLLPGSTTSYTYHDANGVGPKEIHEA